jgi:hypothetical protein
VSRRGSQTRLGAVVRALLREHPAFQANPLGDWSELVGEDVARFSCPVSLKERVLTVVVHDSGWKHHLDLHQEVLLAKINRGFPDPFVVKIVTRVGELPDERSVINPHAVLLDKIKPAQRRSNRRKNARRPLTSAEHALLAELPDADLRRLCGRLLQRLSAPADGTDRSDRHDPAGSAPRPD